MPDSEMPMRGFAPLETLERYHTEDNTWRARHLEGEHRAIDQRLVTLEKIADRIDGRLHDGVGTFKELKGEQEALKKTVAATTTMPIWKIAVIVAAIAGPIAMLAFNAARYPDRGEFERLKTQVDALKWDEAQHHNDLSRAVEGLSTKMDALLRKP